MEPTSTSGDAQEKIVEHEDAAHQKRNWVRLTYDCNDHCVFCLDAHAHNGTNRDREEIKKQILDGRRKGAERLILSGGEPTIHPNFVDFVRLGRMAGYPKIQTVTNGRMFSYPRFLRASLDAGLDEITFSIHGPNAKVHDALVGSKGAFEQELRGLQQALDDGRPIINIDICVNRGNVKHLPEMLRKFTAMGVREYDLLHVIPFGNAYKQGKETLFYNLEEMRPYLLEAFAWSKQPDMHIWLNRFPPQHLEGYEHMIQDPYKLNDEVRGRKEEYAFLLEEGVPLDCRAPHRCQFCYMEPLCDTLEEVRETVASRRFEVVRYDTEFEAAMPKIYGGDPASKKRSRSRMTALTRANESMSQVEQEAAASGIESRLRLPVLSQPGATGNLGGFPTRPVYVPLPELVRAAGAETLWIVAPNLERAASAVSLLPSVTRVELELADYAGLAEALDDGRVLGKRLARVVVRTAEDAAAMLALPGDFEVTVLLSRATEGWLRGLERVPARLALRQPTHERLTESAEQDIELREFFAAFEQLPGPRAPVDDVPACVIGRPARLRPRFLDASMLTDEGQLEIFRYAKRYILDRYWSKSLRCKTCVYNESCRGMHINYIRARGYGLMEPVEPEAAQAS
ncbi:MAG: radical SAM protein [Myxococcales bacterium]|nr:radical SAM protein [Myxococcales bacterium]MCB9754683.1 radical SAM protein [Myxococcales bacterium]